jgi:hypothetical protein
MESEVHIFCNDDDLDYAKHRTVILPQSDLRLDASYRLAHLPLVSPNHPDVISEAAGKYYTHGLHPRVVSIVLPIPDQSLHGSSAFQALQLEMLSSAFAGKIAWDIMPLRKDKLHATLCGSLSISEPPVISPAQREALRQVGPIKASVRGLFSGDINIGRLYLCVYPEKRADSNVLQQIQRAMGARETNMFLVGLYNLTDHLTVNEASELARLIARWWKKPLFELQIDAVSLMVAEDDLVLKSEIIEILPLC